MQSAYAKEVLQQIQSFGESADDEFDVQWAASLTAKNNKSTTNKNDLPNQDQTKEINHIKVKKNLNDKSFIKTPEINSQQDNQILNPFLNNNLNNENQDVTVQKMV